VFIATPLPMLPNALDAPLGPFPLTRRVPCKISSVRSPTFEHCFVRAPVPGFPAERRASRPSTHPTFPSVPSLLYFSAAGVLSMRHDVQASCWRGILNSPLPPPLSLSLSLSSPPGFTAVSTGIARVCFPTVGAQATLGDRHLWQIERSEPEVPPGLAWLGLPS